jgi:hypothetical protein
LGKNRKADSGHRRETVKLPHTIPQPPASGSAEPVHIGSLLVPKNNFDKSGRHNNWSKSFPAEAAAPAAQHSPGSGAGRHTGLFRDKRADAAYADWNKHLEEFLNNT